jgi:adenylylsulfate kinase
MSGTVAWFTGLPSSGKTTLARKVHARLKELGTSVLFLDGDELRDGLRPRPGYSPAERDAFYETLANVASRAAWQGLVVLVAATAHRNVYRRHARAIAPSFVEVFMDTAPAEARRRDEAKALYASAGAMGGGLPGAGTEY